MNGRFEHKLNIEERIEKRINSYENNCGKGYILVEEVPETCIDCRFCRQVIEGIEAYCELENNPEDDELIREIDISYAQDKPDWCPIHKLPNRKYPEQFTISPLIKEQYTEFNRGWNSCLYELANKNRE